MREILFRGRRTDGEWVYGYPVPTTTNCYDKGVEIIDTEGIEYDELDYFNPMFSADHVEPETVGQFTGLTDKNGTKIFEGDIVQAHFRTNHSKQTFRVIFEDGMFLFDNFCVKVPKYDIYSMKVIVNIHDNPELLEG